MKIFRRALYALLILLLVAFAAALIFRIVIGDRYPKDTTQFVFTDTLTEYYRDKGELDAYTQKLRTPYDDAKEGNFFANSPYYVPDADHLQVTLRYNESSLSNVKDKYNLESTPERKDGLFRYVLRVSYNTDAEGDNYQSYEAAYVKESDAYMYHYTKLAFDGVSFEGAAWMCIDVYLVGEEECFGSVVVYEANFEFEGKLYPYEMEKARIPKGSLPQ